MIRSEAKLDGSPSNFRHPLILQLSALFLFSHPISFTFQSFICTKKRTNYLTKVTTLQVIAVEFLHDLGDLDKEALVLDLKRPDSTTDLYEPCAD